MNKRNLIIYRVVTGLFSLHMIFTIVIYIFNFQMVSEIFENIGFPSEFIYPLAGAKFLGLIAIWSNKSRLLKELAYAGFALDFILAAVSHTVTDHGGPVFPLIALAFVTTSFIYHRKLFVSKEIKGCCSHRAILIM